MTGIKSSSFFNTPVRAHGFNKNSSISWASQHVGRVLNTWTWAWFFYGLSCTNNWKGWVFFVFVRDMTDTTIQQTTKATTTSLKKKKLLAGFPFVCTCGSNMWLNFQIEIPKIERGIAEIRTFTMFTIVLACSITSFCCISRLGNEAYIDRLLVSPALCTPIFTLIGNDYFFSCHTNLVSKSSLKTKKKILSRFRGYLGEIESDSQTVWTCMYTIVPRSVFAIFMS